jgi:hypothetical protein
MGFDCPHCHKPIDDDEALLCLYCGGSLNRPVGNFGKMRYALTKHSLWILVGLVILGFLILQIF